MIKDDKRLHDIAKPIAAAAGFDLISAVFFSSKEFQATWRKLGKGLDIKVSDYLVDAPDEVIESFSRSVIGSVAKKSIRYDRVFLDWVTSDDFIIEKRKTYLKRSKNLTRDHIGKERDLAASLDRLLEEGLLHPNEIENSFFSWTSRPNIRKVGFCSPMMRVVGVSSVLDSYYVPEFVLDYVVYHESLHLAQGYRPGTRAHDAAFKRKEKEYPRYEEAEKYLKTLKARLI